MPDQQAAPWSTLPEVVPSEGRKSPPGPELVLTPDPVPPEVVVKVESGESGAHPDPNVPPPSYPIVTNEKRSWFRRRRKAIIIGVVIAVLAVVAIVVGVVVSQTRKDQ